jgi:hypothetical protein
VTIVSSPTRTLLSEQTAGASGELTYGHGGGEIVDILLSSLDYDNNISDQYDLTLPSGNSSIKFQMIDDGNYFNPA